MKQFWEWNALLNRVSDQRQIWTSGPHCLVDCIFPPFVDCWLQTREPRCPFAGRVYWWADAHDTCSCKQARTFGSPAWFASDVDAWSMLIGFLGQTGQLQRQGGSNVSDATLSQGTCCQWVKSDFRTRWLRWFTKNTTNTMHRAMLCHVISWQPGAAERPHQRIASTAVTIGQRGQVCRGDSRWLMELHSWMHRSRRCGRHTRPAWKSEKVWHSFLDEESVVL